VYRFCLVQLDKYIYAVGGCNMEGNLSSVARYLEDSDEWDMVSAMPIALRFVFMKLSLCLNEKFDFYSFLFSIVRIVEAV